MATLSSIRPSILDLPQTDIELIHRLIRSSRMTSKKPASKAVEKRRGEKKQVFSILNSLTPEQAMELLKQIGGDI